MTNLAFLFPGQGSQAVGMGRELYDQSAVARAVFEEADATLGFPLSQLCFDGPEDQLKLTENTQPAILTVSVAVARVLAERGVTPAFVAGHSLGEYSAHVIAGTLSFAEAVRAVQHRGQFMQQAVPAGEGAMAAILGLPAARINDLCAQASDEHADAEAPDSSSPNPLPVREAAAHSIVSPANLNSPEQTVISGAKAAVERAMQLCTEAGAKRTVMLQVSAPFHCQLMMPAREQLAVELECLTFNDPCVPVVSNVDARLVTRRAEARDALIRQVTAPVRWVECIQALIEHGATTFVEVGPGRVLTGLMRQIDRAQKAMNAEDPGSIDKVVASLMQ
jgi:[acyl-carrier-protein] S-malonyltransferase